MAGACGSPQTSTVLSPSAARCELRIDRDSAAFPPAGGSGALAVAVDRECQWTARADASWVTLTGSQGHGAGSVQFTVAANADPSSRTAGVLVNDRRLAIVQEGRPCEFELSSERESVPAAGGRLTIAVRASAAGCPWTASADEPWVSVVGGREGRGDGAATIEVAPAGGAARTATLTIAGLTVRIVQTSSSAPPPGACAVTVAPAGITESATGGSTVIDVAAAGDCAWSAVAESPWIAFSGAASGAGRGQLRVTVAANTGPSRAGAIAIGGQRVIVTQASGCTYAVTPPVLRSTPAGGSAVVSIDTVDGCAWSAASTADWITLGALTGGGGGPVTLSIRSNTGPQRRGTVSIAGHTVTVEQASPCTWSFNPPFHDLAAGGGFGNVLVFVSGPCTWTAESTVEWMRVVSGTSGIGNGLVQFSATPNTGRGRTGAVLIGGERYVVNQAGQ